jgi:hypothetical protein
MYKKRTYSFAVGGDMAKKTAKKKAARAGSTPSIKRSIDLRPTPTQLRAAEACLARSGKIQIGFKAISVTRLPRSITPVVTFDD